ncbi:MAG: hypothetical protein U0133_18660 [Gemmatimonadales bacterium]
MPDLPIPTTPAPRRVGRLHTVGGVRRELARVYREARAGALTAAEASRYANILFLLGRLIQGVELEERLTRLEAAEQRREPWQT